MLPTHHHMPPTPHLHTGLGTSTSKEAKEYFAAIANHRKEFVWDGPEDGQALEMAFSKKKVEERKTWLANFTTGTFLDHSMETIAYRDFVHKVWGCVLGFVWVCTGRFVWVCWGVFVGFVWVCMGVLGLVWVCWGVIGCVE